MLTKTLVNAIDLTQWANRRGSQDLLPRLLRRLIHATIKRVEKISFPADESIHLGGWDGIVKVEMGNAFVPDGYSVWEISTKNDIKSKADTDYEKRCKDPLGTNLSDTTFIFVTPRRWGGKKKWVAERQAEGFWKAVRAYDADDLEAWLELAPSAHIWFSILLRKHVEGIRDLSNIWEDWSGVTSPPLSTELMIAGRKNVVEQLHAWLQDEPSILTLQADSKEEALAFFAATLHQLPTEEREIYLARSIIIEDSAVWRQLASFDESLLLVPMFTNRDTVANAVRKRHHVLIPLGKDEGRSDKTLEIPRLHRQNAEEALVAMGFSDEHAAELASLARRSLTALRRKLAIAPEVQLPKWGKLPEAKTLLPVMLAGTWNDRNTRDREVITKLAKTPYEELTQTLLHWANEPDPPVKHVGDTWMLVSKEDMWNLLAKFLTRDDLDNFENIVLDVLDELDPSYDLPTDQRWMAGALDKPLRYSNLLRTGLTDTVALMGARSTSTIFSDPLSGQEHANRIVRKLLGDITDWRIWASLSRLLPRLAEAAPDEFLNIVEQGLTDGKPIFINLFTDSEDSLFGNSPHTGLLQAFEVLAWHLDYLGWASLLLAKLTMLDPGGKLANRPHNSLREIFLCWRPQTIAGLDRRLQVLDMIKKREPQVAWQLLQNLLPKSHSVAFRTAKPRWRDWVPEPLPEVSYREIWTATREIVARLLNEVGDNGQRWRDLILSIDQLPKDEFDAIVDRLLQIEIGAFAMEARMTVWESLREVISKHREFPDAKWALPIEQVDLLQRVYQRFEPEDPISKYTWLFSNRPSLMKPRSGDWRLYEQAIETARNEAVKKIYSQGGTPDLFKLASRVEQPRELGRIIGRSKLMYDQEDSFLLQTIGSNDNLLKNLGRGFVMGRVHTQGWKWIEARLFSDVASVWTSEQRADFFTCLPFESHTWEHLTNTDEDTQRLYWSQISPYALLNLADCGQAVAKYLEYGRPYAAINLISPHLKEKEAGVSLQMVASILEHTTQTPPDTDVNWNLLSYEIAELLDFLAASDEIEETRIAALEWSFLPLFNHHGRPPKLLHHELAHNPEFFAEIVKLVYKVEEEGDQEETSEDAKIRAELGYQLLESWQQVPGLMPDGCFDAQELRAWINRTRDIMRALGREKIGYLLIGKVFAFAPKGPDDVWPDLAVRDLIEELDNETLEEGIEIGTYNKRGCVSKALDEGGKQERELANSYRGYASMVSDRWPRTAALLRRIADAYESDARREDIKADLRQDLWP